MPYIDDEKWLEMKIRVKLALESLDCHKKRIEELKARQKEEEKAYQER